MSLASALNNVEIMGKQELEYIKIKKVGYMVILLIQNNI